MTLKAIDLFSGIGGFALAADWLGGFTTVQFVEREPFCQKILHKHWPDVPIHDDVCTFNPAPGSADVVVGGFPCQDISAAGKQAGIKEGTRSGLFYELMRIVRMVGPRYVVLENVANITSNGLGIVLGELAEAGYDTEWACIPASAVGACHQRDRWWCVAYAQGGRRRTRSRQGQGQAGHEGSGASDGAAEFAADATGEQRNDLRAAWAGQQAKPESGDGDGQDAAHPMHHRLEGPHELASRWPQWPAAPARLDPDWRGYLSQPVLRRGDDGLSGRAHRLRALGNAVVPQVAMIPLARVLALASEEAQ